MKPDMLKTKEEEKPQPSIPLSISQEICEKGFDIQFIKMDEAIYWSSIGGYWAYSRDGEELKDADNPRDLAYFAEGYNRALKGKK
jgi:hypothetical protein